MLPPNNLNTSYNEMMAIIVIIFCLKHKKALHIQAIAYTKIKNHRKIKYLYPILVNRLTFFEKTLSLSENIMYNEGEYQSKG